MLAKMTGGICDDLLGCVLRAWDVQKKILVAPAMNAMMWKHPVTGRQMRVLMEEWKAWVEVVGPVEKALACGDLGMGGMCEWEVLAEVVKRKLRTVEA